MDGLIEIKFESGQWNTFCFIFMVTCAFLQLSRSFANIFISQYNFYEILNYSFYQTFHVSHPRKSAKVHSHDEDYIVTCSIASFTDDESKIDDLTRPLVMFSKSFSEVRRLYNFPHRRASSISDRNGEEKDETFDDMMMNSSWDKNWKVSSAFYDFYR